MKRNAVIRRWTKEGELALIQDYFIADPFSETFQKELHSQWRKDGISEFQFKARLRRVQMISQGKRECIVTIQDFYNLGMDLLTNPISRNRFDIVMSEVLAKQRKGETIENINPRLPTGEWYEDGVVEDVLQLYFHVINEHGKLKWEKPYTERLLKDYVLASRLPFKTAGANRKRLQDTLKQLIDRIINHPEMYGINPKVLYDLQIHSTQISPVRSEDSNTSAHVKAGPKLIEEIAQDYFRMNPYQIDKLTLFAKLNALWTSQGYPVELVQSMRDNILDALSGKSLETVEMLSEIGEEMLASESVKNYRVSLMKHKEAMQELKTKATNLSEKSPSHLSREQALDLIEAKYKSLQTGKPLYNIVRDDYSIKSFLGQYARDTRPLKQQLLTLVKDVFDKPHSFGVTLDDIDIVREAVNRKSDRGSKTQRPLGIPHTSEPDDTIPTTFKSLPRF